MIGGVFRICREAGVGRRPLSEVFPDLGACPVLQDIFGDGEVVRRVLAQTEVIVADMPHEMFVDNDTGSVTIGLPYLRDASDEYLYLDIVHELCHVRQHMQGRDLYDRRVSYVDRETEIEAYRVTVKEARRIGLDDEAIGRYLRVSWITPEEHRRLVRCLGVHAGVSDDFS